MSSEKPIAPKLMLPNGDNRITIPEIIARPASSQDGIVLSEDLLPQTVEVYLARPSRRQRWVFWLLILLLAGISGWAYFSKVNIVIRAPGIIRPSTDLQVYYAPFDALLERLDVSENATVQAGDTLAVFRLREWKEQQQLTEQELQESQREINDIRRILEVLPAEVSGTNVMTALPESIELSLLKYRSDYSLLQRDLHLMQEQFTVFKKRSDRAERLFDKNVISAEEYDTEASATRLQELKIKQFLNDQEKKLRDAAFALQQTQVAMQKDLAQLRNTIDKAHIIANVSGTISSLRVAKKGIFCNRGTELFAVTPDLELRAEIRVPPKDAGLLRDSLQISYLVEAYSYSDWGAATGYITTIPDDIILDRETGKAYFNVLGSFDSLSLPYKKAAQSGIAVPLRKGLTFQANIIVGQKRLLELLYDKSVDYFHFE